jgi:polyhydroxyalkanoate synthesis repressor PhaR
MSEAQNNGAPVIELRRYPSRKLYNKNASSYVRLPEVAEMIRAGANIRVEDTETGEDVTRAVLLQIIMEQESHGGQGVLSVDLMMDMVRMSQSKASEMMTGLFEQSVAFMRTQQEQLASSVSAGMAGMGAGMGGMPNMFDPAQMQEMQRQYAARLANMWPGTMGAMPGMPGMPGAGPAAKPSAANDAAEIKALKERLEELEKRMGKK